MATVRFTSTIKQWSEQTAKRIDVAVLEMAVDIHRQASILAPKDKRNLVNSGQIIPRGQAHYAVRFGGGSVPYAKRRHFENKKNPQTLRYLERAGDNVSRNAKQYLRGII